MTLKQAWAEFRTGIKEINLKHDVAERAIKAKMDKMTLEEWVTPMDKELQSLHSIMEGMGGFRQMRIGFYGLRKMKEAKRNVRRR